MQLQAFAKINLDLRILGRRGRVSRGPHDSADDWAGDQWNGVSLRICKAGTSRYYNLVVRAVRAFES
jgi:hypothetical protein